MKRLATFLLTFAAGAWLMLAATHGDGLYWLVAGLFLASAVIYSLTSTR